MRCFRIISLLFLLICSSCTAFAQADDTTVYADEPDTATAPYEPEETRPAAFNVQQPSDTQWTKLTTDKDFGYRDKTEYVPSPKEKPHKIPGWLKAIDAFIRFLSSTTGKIVLWSLLALIIGYVIYRILSGEGKKLFAGRSRNMNEAEEATINEEDLLTNNWETRLQKALQQNDHRLAIRYSYMQLLQLLQNRNLISYRQDKTNMEYYRELGNADMKQAFRQIMRQYEYTWYGNFLPAATAFDDYFRTFNSLKSKLHSH